jgi:hypothetical protein
LGDRNFNLFRTLGVSHRERWHSAFIKWILDPESTTGLGDFPLKRFLYLSLKSYTPDNGGQSPRMSLGSIERLKIELSTFETEKSIPPEIEGGDNKKIDVFGELQANFLGSEQDAAIRIQIIIENKVDSLEGDNQTDAYAKWASSAKNKPKPDFIFLVFLAPKVFKLTSKQFVQIKYNGKEYETPSAAGKIVRDNKEVNGWTEWKVNKNGKLTTLDQIRKQFIAKTNA